LVAHASKFGDAVPNPKSGPSVGITVMLMAGGIAAPNIDPAVKNPIRAKVLTIATPLKK
jgi:hypothetical protein